MDGRYNIILHNDTHSDMISISNRSSWLAHILLRIRSHHAGNHPHLLTSNVDAIFGDQNAYTTHSFNATDETLATHHACVSRNSQNGDLSYDIFVDCIEKMVYRTDWHDIGL